MIVEIAQEVVTAHGMGHGDQGQRRGQPALYRFDHLKHQRREVDVIFFEMADMPGAIAIDAAFGCPLTAPVKAHDFEPAGTEFTRDFVVLFHELGMPVEQHADRPAWTARPAPDTGTELVLIGRDEGLGAKVRGSHGFGGRKEATDMTIYRVAKQRRS